MKVCSPSNIKDISADLRQKIVGGEIKVGDFLPTMNGLSKMYGCSIAMVSKVLLNLINEGLVEQRKGLGTRVIKNTNTPQSVHLDAVACIYPSELHEAIWTAAKGFQNAAREADRRVVMLTTGTDYQKETEFIGRLSEFDVRGAVIFPVIPTPQAQIHFAQMLVNSKFPVVLAEVSLPGFGCPSVATDGFHAGHTMTRHMIERGARRIGYFSNSAWAPSIRERYLGYSWALQEAGIQEPAAGVFQDFSSTHPDFNNPLAESTQRGEDFLNKACQLDAVVCAEDFLALGVIAAAKAKGIKVPGDMLVTGVGDFALASSSVGIALTTYHVPYEEMGRKAFEVLSARLGSGENNTSETQIRGHIVVRKSA
jgi:DNA-binding LacI/PurR family transcriptional regulator